MNKADLMFYDLGYIKQECIGKLIIYAKEYSNYVAQIEFNLKDRVINCGIFFNDNDYLTIANNSQSLCFNAEKINAIREKCFELGWLKND